MSAAVSHLSTLGLLVQFSALPHSDYCFAQLSRAGGDDDTDDVDDYEPWGGDSGLAGIVDGSNETADTTAASVSRPLPFAGCSFLLDNVKRFVFRPGVEIV